MRRNLQTWRSPPLRGFGSLNIVFSGHNRWSKIRHEKGKEDALKSKARSLLSQEIYIASKLGGPDPILNSRLGVAIANAKKGALPKTSIESAIAKGQGKSVSGAPLESLTIEAMLPFFVAAIIECQTDQKARVLQDIRFLIKDHGGIITPTGYLFEKKGRIIFERKKGIGPDDILEKAIEIGAMDVALDEEGKISVDTGPSKVSDIAMKLAESFGLRVEKSSIIYDPKPDTVVSLKDQEAHELETVLKLIEEDPSVQEVYVNVVLTDGTRSFRTERP